MDTQKPNKRKQRIIDAAIRVIKKKSIEEATVREIAAEAGLTSGAIYHHYKNKDDLMFDVINHSIHFSYQFSDFVNNISDTHHNLLEEIQEGVSHRLSQIDEQKLHISLLSEVISKGGPLQEKYKENYNTILKNIADLYFLSCGVNNPVHQKSLAAIFTAALDGIAIQNSLGILPDDQTAFNKAFIEFFSDSIPTFLEKYKD